MKSSATGARGLQAVLQPLPEWFRQHLVIASKCLLWVVLVYLRACSSYLECTVIFRMMIWHQMLPLCPVGDYVLIMSVHSFMWSPVQPGSPQDQRYGMYCHRLYSWMSHTMNQKPTMLGCYSLLMHGRWSVCDTICMPGWTQLSVASST